MQRYKSKNRFDRFDNYSVRHWSLTTIINLPSNQFGNCICQLVSHGPTNCPALGEAGLKQKKRKPFLPGWTLHHGHWTCSEVINTRLWSTQIPFKLYFLLAHTVNASIQCILEWILAAKKVVLWFKTVYKESRKHRTNLGLNSRMSLRPHFLDQPENVKVLRYFL